jgi:hypothetical protein
LNIDNTVFQQLHTIANFYDSLILLSSIIIDEYGLRLVLWK